MLKNHLPKDVGGLWAYTPLPILIFFDPPLVQICKHPSDAQMIRDQSLMVAYFVVFFPLKYFFMQIQLLIKKKVCLSLNKYINK